MKKQPNTGFSWKKSPPLFPQKILANFSLGYFEIYDTYTFATLKGAGHEAPAFTPFSAFEMFRKFLSNEPFDVPPPTGASGSKKFSGAKTAEKDARRRLVKMRNENRNKMMQNDEN